MDHWHMFMNFTTIPVTLLVLLLITPPYLVFKFLRFVVNSTFRAENLAGKVILITGASSGIGEKIAYEYARRGARLAIAARREDRLRQVAETASKLGSSDVLIVVVDVSKANDCRRMVQETIDHFGQVNHLVNNAGITSNSLFENYPEISDSTKSVMEINFWGSVYATKYAIPHLKRSRGKIIVISSVVHRLPQPRSSIYNATKAAMVNFFETLRVELGSAITVTIIAPWYTDSEMIRGKVLDASGEMKIDTHLKNFLETNKYIVSKGEDCAKAIVDSARRGDRYLTQPIWAKIQFYVKLFCPELLEWIYRITIKMYSRMQ
ncbi:hypothetical protein Droror1_Dr00013563 [Drosera rotundifolia]